MLCTQGYGGNAASCGEMAFLMYQLASYTDVPMQIAWFFSEITHPRKTVAEGVGGYGHGLVTQDSQHWVLGQDEEGDRSRCSCFRRDCQPAFPTTQHATEMPVLWPTPQEPSRDGSRLRARRERRLLSREVARGLASGRLVLSPRATPFPPGHAHGGHGQPGFPLSG